MKNKLLILTAVAIATATTTLSAAEEERKKPAGKDMDPAKAAAAMVKKADTDESGGISAAEFASTKMAEGAKKRGGEEAVGKVFARMDGDSDGSITQAELQTALEKRAKGGKGGKGAKKES